MALYELGVVVDPSIEGEERDAFLNEVKEIVTSGGGEFVKEDVWGKRTLAYEIDHKREGYYVFWQFEAPGTVITPLEYKLRIADPVMRYLTLNLDRELRRARKAERVKAARKAKKAAAERAAAAAAAESGEAAAVEGEE